MGKVEPYPREVHEFVKTEGVGIMNRELAELCNEKFGTQFTEGKMKAFRCNHGYKSNCPHGLPADSKYPEGFREFVQEHSWGHSNSELAQMVSEKFGIRFTRAAMCQYRHKRNLKSGVTGHFKKGNVPMNKGKKQTDYMSPEAIEASVATRFRKGNVPHNHKEVGEVRMVYPYSAKPYLSIKVAEPNKWEFLHRHIWEQHNGPIPEGMLVNFRNGDTMDCRIENLMLVSMSENAVMNHLGFRSEFPEITETGLNIARLKLAIKKKKKEKNNENNND